MALAKYNVPSVLLSKDSGSFSVAIIIGIRISPEIECVLDKTDTKQSQFLIEI